MNPLYHSEDSCPSTCSSSIASLSSLPMTPETYPESNPSVIPALYPPLAPPLLDLEHAKSQFYIGPESFEEHPFECHTVVEEEEDDETASETQEPLTPTGDSHSGIFISSSNEGFQNMQDPPTILINTPPSPSHKSPSPVDEQSTAAPTRGELRRRASKKIHGFMRRVHSTGHVSTELSNGQLTPSPTRSKGFFFPERNVLLQATAPLPIGSTVKSTTATLEPIPAPRSVGTFGGKSSSPKRPGLFSRRSRSNSMNGIKDLTGNPITHPAMVGAGSKSRKMSSVVPVMNVPVFPLSSMYANHSHVPGKSKICGEGVSAIVKVMHKVTGPSGELYAVKEFRKKSRSETKEEYVEKVNSEFCISKSLSHPNIVSTEDLCVSNSDRWCHVMEYCSGGDLFSLIEKSFMKEDEKLCCFKQLLRGVSYLHDHGIAHRDIKPENLLISSDGHLKITDFGVSEVFRGKHPGDAGIKCGIEMDEIRLSKPGVVGSAPYISPEVQNKEGLYDARKLDVWSCAMVYFVLAFGGPLWHMANISESSQYSKYVDGFNTWLERNPSGEMTKEGNYPRHFVFASLKPATKRLLFQMMHLDPSKRITIQDALADRWVQSIECCNVDDHNDPYVKHVDAGSKSACKQAGKVGVHRLHLHLPPTSSTPFGREL